MNGLGAADKLVSCFLTPRMGFQSGLELEFSLFPDVGHVAVLMLEIES